MSAARRLPVEPASSPRPVLRQAEFGFARDGYERGPHGPILHVWAPWPWERLRKAHDRPAFPDDCVHFGAARDCYVTGCRHTLRDMGDGRAACARDMAERHPGGMSDIGIAEAVGCHRETVRLALVDGLARLETSDRPRVRRWREAVTGHGGALSALRSLASTREE